MLLVSDAVDTDVVDTDVVDTDEEELSLLMVFEEVEVSDEVVFSAQMPQDMSHWCA